MKILRHVRKALAKKPPFVFCFLVLFVSFGDSCIPKEKKQVLALVFCDITNSVDRQTIDVAIDKLKKFVEVVPPKSKIVVYPIDNNDYPPKIFEFEVPECKDPNQTGVLADQLEKQCKDKLKAKIEGFGTLTRNKYDTLLKDNKIKQRSCIMGTLRTAHEFFKNYDRKRYHFEVVYLSDMIEECESPVGSIYMCSKQLKPVASTILKMIDEKYNPQVNVKDLLGNNISIVVTSNLLGSDESKCVFADEHRAIWEKVFTKAGYSPQDFASFSFSPEIPPRFDGLKTEDVE